MSQPLVFVSYSHKDEAEKDKLLSHLGVLQSDLIDIWSDDRLGGGVNWEREISKSISQAKVAILLITANFLTSKFILQKEVKSLLERREKEGVNVFPVIARACAWTKVKWLVEMNVRPRNGTPVWSDAGAHVDEDLARIAEEVADLIEKANDGSARSLDSGPAQVPTSPAVAEEPTAKRPKSPKLLIVDDDADFRDSVKFGLKDMNILPVEAESVEEATKLLTKNRNIRVILLDLEFKDGESGTAVLEFIKDRASYYRVIIVTSHDELLAADKASSYNVFSYLSKVNGKVPMQMLRFAVTRAFDDLKREESDNFGENMLGRYPAPFIHIYQQLKSEMTPLEKVISQKDMLELLVHFSALVLLSEYLNSQGRSEALDAQVRSRIYKPALGDWFNIINEIVKRRTDFGKTVFLEAFLTFFTGRNKKILGDFIAIRNRYVGHGTRHSDYEYADVVKKCDQWIGSLLQDYQFITHLSLCYVLSVQVMKGKYLCTLKECLGGNPQLLNSTKPLKILLNTHEMQLVDLATERSQSLHPFIVLENCPECRQLEMFFYSKFSNGQLHYISYTTGHWLIKEEGANEFLELIKAGK